MVRVRIFDHCHASAMGLDLPALEDLAAEAFPLCLRESISESALPADLAEVEVSLVTAAEIARLHDEFMDDPSPTDVITFHHGEILISPETAQQQRRPHGHSLQREVALYLIHGLLHLAGHEDTTDAGAELMKRLQERILSEVAPVA